MTVLSDSDGILVYIESVDRIANEILFDFIDSNEFIVFQSLLGIDEIKYGPSMILLKNYKGRRIQENTIYSISKEAITSFLNEGRIIPYTSAVDNNNVSDSTSIVIGYTIRLSQNERELFNNSVSLTPFEQFERGVNFTTAGKVSLIPKDVLPNSRAVVRDVGQGNWNELWSEERLYMIFDCGAPSKASKSEVHNYIGNREEIIARDAPGVLISHWDLDHYHSLVGMNDSTLGKFSYFICRDHFPTLTSRLILGRMRAALGPDRIFSISAGPKLRNIVPMRLLSDAIANVLIFNAHYHKDRNRSGIAVAIRTGGSSIIFSGDAHYYQISDYILPHLDYTMKHHIVVPHHGGNAGHFIYRMKRARPTHAIISVGNNSYGHPKQDNIDKLVKSGFHISQTRIKKADIEIRL